MARSSTGGARGGIPWLLVFAIAAIAGGVALYLIAPKAEGAALIHVSIAAEEVFTIGGFSVTNSMIGAVLASLVLLAAAWFISRRSHLVPGRLQSLIELPIELLAGIVSGSSSRWRSYAALIFGLFLMIIVANWMGLLPGVGTVGVVHHEEGHAPTLVPFVRPASADLNFTLGLAIIAVVMFIYWGIRANGLGGYLKELAGEPWYLTWLIFPINVISELSRLISLSMRLFGNVFAGEILITTMLALTTAAVFVLPLAFFAPALFLGLELLFGAVQALVFALLALTYISTAIAEHHAAGHADEHGDADEAHPTHPPAAEAASS
jgi:F-type H+-transporting ATPase subunit a